VLKNQRCAGTAAGHCANHAHAVGVHCAQPLPESFQAAQCTFPSLHRPAVAVAHPAASRTFPEAVKMTSCRANDAPRPCEAVGTQVDGGETSVRHDRRSSTQATFLAENEDPQTAGCFRVWVTNDDWAPVDPFVVDLRAHAVLRVIGSTNSWTTVVFDAGNHHPRSFHRR